MKPTLVTGANGHVGNNLCRLLVHRGDRVRAMTGTRPMLDRSQVDEFAGKYGYFDSSKAERELGYTYLSARETVGRTIAWLVARGFVTERRQRTLRLHPSLQGAAAAG